MSSRTAAMAPTPPNRRAEWMFSAACAFVIALIVAAYSNSLDNSFHFDDSHVIEENLFIRDLHNILRFFTDARTFSAVPANSTYRPIVSTSLAIDYALGHGLTPRPFHLTQILLLLVTGAMLAVLFTRVLSRLGPSPWHRWTALAAAAFFCVHVGNSEPVNYICARSELLSGIGILGTLLVYAGRPNWRRYQLHLVPLAFGMLAKTPTVVVAPLLLVYDLLIERRMSFPEVFSRAGWPRTRAALVAVAPAFVAALGLYVFIERMNPPGQTYGGGGRLQYLITETWVWLRYGAMFVVPRGLTADTDLEPFANPWNLRVAAGALFAVVMLTLMWIASKGDRTRPVAFGIAWFALGLIPSSTIFPLAEVANDHRMFLPFMGLSLAAVAWLADRAERFAASPAQPRARIAFAGALAVLVLLAHAVGTYQRNRVWRTEETLWADVVAKSPKNGRGLMNYGLTQMEQARYARARDLFLEADALLPNYSTLEVNLAIVENALGRPAVADSHFVRALALTPDHPAPHRYYARWLMAQGRGPEAISHLERTIALSPADVEARHMLMSLLAARGSEELAPLATQTLSLASTDTIAGAYARGVPPQRPDAPGAWVPLGTRLMHEHRYADAAEANRAALAQDSTNADAWNNLGWALGKLGFFDEAVAAFQRALFHHPGDALATNNLKWAIDQQSDATFRRAFERQRDGHPGEAVAIYRGLLARYPRWVNVHNNLGDALMAEGRQAEAIAEFRRTLQLDPTQHGARLNLAACLAAVGASPDANDAKSGTERLAAAPDAH